MQTIPILSEPPIVHAKHNWDEATHTLSYEYNGRRILSIAVPEMVKPFFRHGSDGNLQSTPFLQQLYVALEAPAKVKITFQLSSDVLNVRPNRARSENGIIGQNGRPLVFGVNGLYDIRQDLLIDWHGANWNWIVQRLFLNEAGDYTAELEVELGPSPWIINLRMHYYRLHLNYANHKPWQWRPELKPVSGWCSWEAFRSDVKEEDVAEAAAFVATHFKPYGMEYVQLDDGFQLSSVPPTPDASVPDSWLNTNGKFPGGHQRIVSSIAAHGLEPGIWTNAVVTNSVFAQEQDYCMKDTDGNPIKGPWINYVLNCSPETLEEQVAPFYEGLRREGYTYFKTDAIRHLIFDGFHEAVRLGLITNQEGEDKFRAYMTCARTSIGDDVFLLACWGMLSQAVGIADACRVATDSNPSWSAIRMQLVESARWFHTQRILFLNDPDHICARTDLEWARSLLSLVSLSGGLFMLSDPLANYDEARIDMIQKCLPPLPTVTGETGVLNVDYAAFAWTHVRGYAVDIPKETREQGKIVSDENAFLMAGRSATMCDAHPFSSLWSFHMDVSDRMWCVAGRFATVPLHESEIELVNLGLNPELTYLVFNFWEQRFVGTVTKCISMPALKVGHCQILSFYVKMDRPQCIASSRHVSMDAVSILSEIWNGAELVLNLTGVEGTSETYWVHIPEGYSLKDYDSDELMVSVQADKEIAGFEVCFNKRSGIVNLQFESRI